MAFAICVKCGEKKPEAFAVCPGCSFDPARASKELQAKSLWLSDEQLRADALEQLAKQIKAGKNPAMDPKSMDSMMRQLRTQQNYVLPKKGSPTLYWLMGLAVVIAAGVVFLLSR